MIHVRHLLEPGTSGYAALKLGAIAGVAGISLAARRRGHDHDPAGDTEPAPPRRPHPRSKKRKRRRR